MERKLKTALLATIDGYNAIVRQLKEPSIPQDRHLQLLAGKAVYEQVLQNFNNAEYIEWVDDQWRIKLIVTKHRAFDGEISEKA
ncbi:hypothetical protein [Sporomusa aerivorans]|uniref:hypothetical protein n=1 Tax=Sporomusa aerivorans TaxID=204936 RepID=UPI00352A00BA